MADSEGAVGQVVPPACGNHAGGFFPRPVMRSQGFGDINLGSEYTPDQFEFLKAMERYKRVRRRPFPTWHEVLEVLISLGYRKVEESPGGPT